MCINAYKYKGYMLEYTILWIVFNSISRAEKVFKLQFCPFITSKCFVIGRKLLHEKKNLIKSFDVSVRLVLANKYKT